MLLAAIRDKNFSYKSNRTPHIKNDGLRLERRNTKNIFSVFFVSALLQPLRTLKNSRISERDNMKCPKFDVANSLISDISKRL